MPGVNPPSGELPESEAARCPPTGDERLRAVGKLDDTGPGNLMPLCRVNYQQVALFRDHFPFVCDCGAPLGAASSFTVSDYVSIDTQHNENK